MHDPLDIDPESRTGSVRLARDVSTIINPAVMFAILGLVLGITTLPLGRGILWGAIYGVAVALLPGAVILYLRATDRITDIHMTRSEDRNLPYFAAVVGSAIMLVITRLVPGPEIFFCLAKFTAIMLGLLAIINYFWRISIHASAATALMLIIGYVNGIVWGMALLPLVVFVAALRLYLRRHSAAQIIAGIALTAVVVMLLVATGCFMG